MTNIDKKFSVFDLALPRKPLALLKLGHVRGKLILNTNFVEVATHR